jgi:hypothetical protein
VRRKRRRRRRRRRRREEARRADGARNATARSQHLASPFASPFAFAFAFRRRLLSSPFIVRRRLASPTGAGRADERRRWIATRDDDHDRWLCWHRDRVALDWSWVCGLPKKGLQRSQRTTQEQPYVAAGRAIGRTKVQVVSWGGRRRRKKVADPCKMHPPPSTVLWGHTNIPCSMAPEDMLCPSRKPAPAKRLRPGAGVNCDSAMSRASRLALRG